VQRWSVLKLLGSVAVVASVAGVIISIGGRMDEAPAVSGGRGSADFTISTDRTAANTATPERVRPKLRDFSTDEDLLSADATPRKPATTSAPSAPIGIGGPSLLVASADDKDNQSDPIINVSADGIGDSTGYSGSNGGSAGQYFGPMSGVPGSGGGGGGGYYGGGGGGSYGGSYGGGGFAGGGYSGGGYSGGGGSSAPTSSNTPPSSSSTPATTCTTSSGTSSTGSTGSTSGTTPGSAPSGGTTSGSGSSCTTTGGSSAAGESLGFNAGSSGVDMQMISAPVDSTTSGPNGQPIVVGGTTTPPAGPNQGPTIGTTNTITGPNQGTTSGTTPPAGPNQGATTGTGTTTSPLPPKPETLGNGKSSVTLIGTFSEHITATGYDQWVEPFSITLPSGTKIEITIDADVLPLLYEGEAFDVIIANGGLTGTFAVDGYTDTGIPELFSNYYKWWFEPIYGPNTLTLIAHDPPPPDGLPDDALRLAVAAVPEPATLAIFGLGMVGIGYLRRRRAAA